MGALRARHGGAHVGEVIGGDEVSWAFGRRRAQKRCRWCKDGGQAAHLSRLANPDPRRSTGRGIGGARRPPSCDGAQRLPQPGNNVAVLHKFRGALDVGRHDGQRQMKIAACAPGAALARKEPYDAVWRAHSAEQDGGFGAQPDHPNAVRSAVIVELGRGRTATPWE